MIAIIVVHNILVSSTCRNFLQLYETSTIQYVFIRLASLGGGPQAHVHMEGKKFRVLYLNLLGMNALFL